MNLIKLLASSLRQNMLRELSMTEEIRMMELVRRVDSTYNEVNRNSGIMEEMGIIFNEYPVKVRHGKIRVIKLNRENPKTKVLLKALKTLDDHLPDP